MRGILWFGRTAVDGVCCGFFVRSFVCSSVRSFVRPRFSLPFFVRSFVRSSVRPSVRSFVRSSFVRSFVVRSSVRPFVVVVRRRRSSSSFDCHCRHHAVNVPGQLGWHLSRQWRGARCRGNAPETTSNIDQQQNMLHFVRDSPGVSLLGVLCPAII